MIRTLKAHFEAGRLVFDETLPCLDDGTAVAVTLVYPDSTKSKRPDAWTGAAMDSAFRDDEDWGDSLDGLVAEDRA